MSAITDMYTRWANACVRLLAGTGITPNQVSVFGVLITVVCGACLVVSREQDDELRAVLLLAAAACIPVRALCNMFDGMLAVEYGKQTKSGLIFNELPDRLSDAIYLVAAGYAVPDHGWTEALGWAAGLLAVLTAYVRALGDSAGVGQFFTGPMGKQQRMAILALASALSAFEGVWGERGLVLEIALVSVVAGCVLTIAVRTVQVVKALESS